MSNKGWFVSSLVGLAAGAGTVAAQQPQAKVEGPDPLDMQEIVVIGTASEQRTKFDSSVAITTFSAEDIERQAPASTADLISAVPGFWVESTSGTTQGNVFARGIIQDGGYRYVGLMEDGIPIYPVFELSFYNPDQFVRLDETVQRVEALRGGTAPLFTAGAVGGTIDFVTRDPGSEPELIVKGTVSDYSMYRADVYWGGPVGAGWGLAVGGFYRRSDGIRDPGYDADKGGQIRAKLVREIEGGNLEFFAKYINDRSLFVVPIPLQGDPSDPDGVAGADAGEYSLHSVDLARAGLPPSAAEVGLQDSDLEDGIHPELFTIGGRLRWNVTDEWILDNRLRYTDGDVRFDGIFSGDPPVPATQFAADRGVAPVYTVISTGEPYDASQLVQNHGHWAINKDYEAIQNDLRLSFSQGPHFLTLGLYYADYSMDDRWTIGNLLLMDVANRPRRLLLPGVTDPQGFTQYSSFNLLANYDAELFSIYLTEEWQATPSLRIDVGVRYDDQEIDASISRGVPDVDLDGDPATTYDIAFLAGEARDELSPSFDNVSWSIGFNYELNERHAFFGHYTDAAKLPHFDDVRNGVLREDEVTNIEIGYKTLLPQAGLSLFVTLFQTEFDNVPFTDILADGSTIVREAATETRGIELEGTWQPIEAFSVGFTLTLQDPEYEDFTGSAVDNTGNQIRRIPKEFGRLTPAWHFNGGRGQLYATYSYYGKRYSNDENTVVLPSYNKLDAGVIYDLSDTLRLQLVGDNLTDEVGLTEGNPRIDIASPGIGDIFMARPLFGRSFWASATYRF